MSNTPKVNLTPEQEAVIYADDHHVSVQAYAGTGKILNRPEFIGDSVA